MALHFTRVTRTAMNRLGCVLVLFLTALPANASPAVCSPQMLRPPVLGLVRPLLEMRIEEAQADVVEDGHRRGPPSVTVDIEKRFEALLENRTKAGDEALAYLLNVYLGEHLDEQLVCEVTNRGRRMLSLIDSYATCTPLTGLEPLPENVRGSGGLFKSAKDAIARGEECGPYQ